MSRRPSYQPHDWTTAQAVGFVLSLTALAVVISTALLLWMVAPAW